MSKKRCECLSESCETRRLHGQLVACRVASLIPGVELTDVRRHVRHGSSHHDDGWMVVERLRRWVGLAGWRDLRRTTSRPIDLTEAAAAEQVPVRIEAPRKELRDLVNRSRELSNS